MATLTIRPAPFKPSLLSTQPSPFSPRSPFSPTAGKPRPIISLNSEAATARTSSQQQQQQPSYQRPELEPAAWSWTCGNCKRHYPIGATRRCLSCDHNFCAGLVSVRVREKRVFDKRGRSIRAMEKGEATKAALATTAVAGFVVPVRRRLHRCKPCVSEFDYAGWKAHAVWRRLELDSLPRKESAGWAGVSAAERRQRRNCWLGCDYPSECRWGDAYSVQSPVPPARLTSVPEEGEGEEEVVDIWMDKVNAGDPQVPSALDTIFHDAKTLAASVVSSSGLWGQKGQMNKSLEQLQRDLAVTEEDLRLAQRKTWVIEARRSIRHDQVKRMSTLTEEGDEE